MKKGLPTKQTMETSGGSSTAVVANAKLHFFCPNVECEASQSPFRQTLIERPQPHNQDTVLLACPFCYTHTACCENCQCLIQPITKEKPVRLSPTNGSAGPSGASSSEESSLAFVECSKCGFTNVVNQDLRQRLGLSSFWPVPSAIARAIQGQIDWKGYVLQKNQLYIDLYNKCCHDAQQPSSSSPSCAQDKVEPQNASKTSTSNLPLSTSKRWREEAQEKEEHEKQKHTEEEEEKAKHYTTLPLSTLTRLLSRCHMELFALHDSQQRNKDLHMLLSSAVSSSNNTSPPLCFRVHLQTLKSLYVNSISPHYQAMFSSVETFVNQRNGIITLRKKVNSYGRVWKRAESALAAASTMHEDETEQQQRQSKRRRVQEKSADAKTSPLYPWHRSGAEVPANVYPIINNIFHSRYTRLRKLLEHFTKPFLAFLQMVNHELLQLYCLLLQQLHQPPPTTSPSPSSSTSFEDLERVLHNQDITIELVNKILLWRLVYHSITSCCCI
ncbi:hypothetical protein QOT17_005139 [Balamuthia mandrillaris]